MSDVPALLAAILAAPDDDAPRLVYADWLDDHDRGREATYIRAAVAAAAAPPCRAGDFEACDCVVCAAAGMAEDLGRDDWYAWPEAAEVAVRDSRGLPAWVMCQTAVFLARARDLFTTYPTVTGVELTDKRSSLGAWNRADPDRPGRQDGAAFTLPADLWDALAGGVLEPSPSPRTTYDRRVYPTQTATWEDLSRACVAIGRARAGLPEPPG